MLLLVALVACSPAPAPAPAPASSGELLIEQLHLRSGIPGESALVIGPDGTSLLIDVGHGAHTAEVEEALARHGLEGVEHVVLTHDDIDHVGGFDDLFGEGGLPLPEEVYRFDTVEPPVTVALGDGAVLTLFLADGLLATDGGAVDLSEHVDLGEEDNPRSLAGVVQWGDFRYLFAGDLTGGGKGTPDVEGAVVAHADVLPWVPADGVEVMHVNHHGISSSTSPAWADWARPRHAVVGANNGYLDAPSPEALQALAPWVETVWVTEDGLLGNADERTRVVHGPVAVRVSDGGATVTVGE